jgi:hypothetical protein
MAPFILSARRFPGVLGADLGLAGLPNSPCAFPWVPQLNACMVKRIWSLTCENTPDLGTSRV